VPNKKVASAKQIERASILQLQNTPNPISAAAAEKFNECFDKKAPVKDYISSGAGMK